MRYGGDLTEIELQVLTSGGPGVVDIGQPPCTVLYLRFYDVRGVAAIDLHHALTQVASKLWGPVTVTWFEGGDFALTLENWSAFRARQLCQVLELAAERGFRRLGREVRMEVGLATGARDDPPEVLLDRARRACPTPLRCDAHMEPEQLRRR